jgi:hypothetical protein
MQVNMVCRCSVDGSKISSNEYLSIIFSFSYGEVRKCICSVDSDICSVDSVYESLFFLF